MTFANWKLKSDKRTIFVLSMGIMLEYYDFAIYGLLAPYLSKIFFPQTSANLALLQTLGIFSASYFARTIGGLIAGIIGDRHGRVKPLLYSIMAMAATTLGIALLPSYDKIGWAAPVILLLLRVAQGIAFGAETPGAITFLIERYSHNKNRGVTGSYFIMSTAFGSVLGTLVMLVLSLSFSPEQIVAWGWRLPFILGSSLALIGLWLRQNLLEVSSLLQSHALEPITNWFTTLLFKQHYKQLLQGFVLVFVSAGVISFGQTIAVFLNTYYGYPLKEIYKNLPISFVLTIFLPPLFGWISDKIGRKFLLILISLFFLGFCFPVFNFLNSHSHLALATCIAFIYFVAIVLSCAYIPLLVELFPTAIRYTGVAICLNLGTAIGGIIPFLFHSIAYKTGTTLYAIIFFNLLGVLSLITSLLLNMKRPEKLL